MPKVLSMPRAVQSCKGAIGLKSWTGMSDADDSCDTTESNHNHFPQVNTLHDKKQKVVKPPYLVKPKAKRAWEKC
jgi:hypothetical protein